MLNALRNAMDQSTAHIQIRHLQGAVTVDEVFDYYRSVVDMVLVQRGNLMEQSNAADLDREVCEWIDSHLYDPDLSLNIVCDHFSLSAKTIGMICKRKYGTTFLQYVRSRQIEKATELLKETDRSLEEIAKTCGFTNVLTFRRNFKAVKGINPSDFRQ